MTARTTHMPTVARPARRGRGGFTMVELLVVISIIVMILAASMPLFNTLSGNRSVDAAQNSVSAMLQRARSRAVALQERRGVFFYDDPQSGRVAMQVVRVVNPQANWRVLESDVDNAEPELLPPGVGAAIAYSETQKAGLVCFDGYGRVEFINYKLGTTLTLVDPGLVTEIAAVTSPVTGARSAVTILMYERRAFSSQDPNGETKLTYNPAQKAWIEGNAQAVVVNRYNGTLIVGE